MARVPAPDASSPQPPRPSARQQSEAARHTTPDRAHALAALDGLLAPPRNFMHLDDEYTDFAAARAVVLPVPFDATTCYRPGTREGPQAIIDASRNLELYDPDLGFAPADVGIHTLRAVEPIMGDSAAMVARVEAAAGAVFDLGKLLAALGGDHSTTIGIARALAARKPGVSVLQLDAHADLRDEYEGNRLSSATIMHRVLDTGLRTAQVGIRSLSAPEAELVAERKLPLWLASAIKAQSRRGDQAWMDEVLAALGDEVYITFDIDAFDPSLVPGTGTPEPGGLDWYEATDLLARVAHEKRIIGFDVVELSPLVEGHVSPVVAAKLVYRMIGLATRTPSAGRTTEERTA